MDKEAWQQINSHTDQIGQVINKLAEKLGVASEYVFELLVKQKQIEGIINVPFSGLMFIAGVLFIIFLLRENDLDIAEMIEDYTASSIVAIALTVIGGISLVLSVLQIMNPEYYAIRDIVDMLSGLKD